VPYIYYARSLAGAYPAFLAHLVKDLTGTGASFKENGSPERGSLMISHNGESGILRVVRQGADIEVTYAPEGRNISTKKSSLCLLIEEKVGDIDAEMKALLEEGEVLPATETGETNSSDQIRQSLEEMYQELLTVREEINHLREQDRDVSRPERRARRAHQLYEEAVFELEKRHAPAARARARAMQIMIEKAEASLGEIGD
jgi:hypothetical protein